MSAHATASGAALALALAGCGGSAPSPAPTGAASEAVAPAATGSPTGGGGGGLSGQVSALSGDVSGLNTRVSDLGLIIDLPADALFEFDRATLTPNAVAELTKAAELIRRSPAGPIRVVGHTDSKGDHAYNQRLSEARARAVAGWFGGQVGVRTRAFQVSGAGEGSPVAPNARPDGSDDPAGRARNRRVEVIVPAAR